MGSIYDHFFKKHQHLYRYDGLFAYSEVRFHKWFEEFKTPVAFEDAKYRYSKVDAVLALSTVLDLENNLHKDFYYRPFEFFSSNVRWSTFNTRFRNHCLYLFAEHKNNSIYSGTKLFKIKKNDLEDLRNDYSEYLTEIYEDEREEIPKFKQIEISLLKNEPTFKVDYELAIVDEIEMRFVTDVINIKQSFHEMDYNIIKENGF